MTNVRASAEVIHVPLNRPTAVPGSLEYVAQSARSMHTSGDGEFVLRCEALLSELHLRHRVLLTPSGTAALELAMLLLHVQHGDEVILPSFTFPSAANAVVLRGARPVWIDIRADTLNLDERLLPGLITPRTKAIVPTHYAGVACAMDEILKVAAEHNVAVVEDNALGIFGTYRNRPLGTLGGLATLSFHETKNFSCGEGGAMVLNDAGYIESAEILREKGTDRQRFLRGEVPQYQWQAAGSSVAISDLTAAYLLAQLEQRDWIQAQRSQVWSRYSRELAIWAGENGITLPSVPEYASHPSNLFYMMMPSAEIRGTFIAHLRSLGIAAAHHYVPLHSSAFGLRFSPRVADLPVTESASKRVVRLPLFTGMSSEDVDEVIAAVLSFTHI